MPRSTFSNSAGGGLAATLLLGMIGCGQVLSPVSTSVIMADAVGLAPGDLAGPGAQTVASKRIELHEGGENLMLHLYQPVETSTPLSAVVFLPGLMASDDQYESYARALASRGFVVAVRGWYSPFRDDVELARDASLIADWLVRSGRGDPGHIGVAGHSMGGKDAVLAALEDERFSAVVAIDPDDGGEPSVAQGPVAWLHAPLLLIGAEVGWQAAAVCAPKETNYRRFFERAPAGTVEITLRDADHVQMLDHPDRFGYAICRSGTADTRQVRLTARRATVGFFLQHLHGGAPMTSPPSAQVHVRVVQPDAASAPAKVHPAEEVSPASPRSSATPRDRGGSEGDRSPL